MSLKIANIMNFVRSFEPRNPAIEEKMVIATREQLKMVNELHLDATFLIQYDALKDERYLEIFKSAVGDNIELGLWYEIVEPLTTDVGMKYRSKKGYRWDWNIDPGFPMSYTPKEREILIDRAMQTFRETFGFYPRTVGSWAIDTHTVNHLVDRYGIDAVCICRDQVNTDAYTLVGGYFNGMYYPSRSNVFTPAQTKENQTNVVVIRLLGPDPIHNYDSEKLLSEERKSIKRGDPSEPFANVFTLEPACKAGCDPKAVKWFFDSLLGNKSLSHGYVQIGQENSFARFDIVNPVRRQAEELIARGDVRIMKMCDAAKCFRRHFDRTPAAAVTALENWDSVDCRSVVYSSASYTANLLYREGTVALRYWYLFDEAVEDKYLSDKCTTFDCVYENLPIIDTYPQRGDGDGGEGFVLTRRAADLSVKELDDRTLSVDFGDGGVVFHEDGITVRNCHAVFAPQMKETDISLDGSRIRYAYRSHTYSVLVTGGTVSLDESGSLTVIGSEVELVPLREGQTPSKR